MTFWLILTAHWLVLLIAIAVAVGCVRLAKKAHWTSNPAAEQKTVWFIRHQCAGVLYACPFEREPTPAQLEHVMQTLSKIHVRAEGKDPWWCRTIEVPLLSPTATPLLPDQPPGPPEANVTAAILPLKISASGKFRAKGR